MCTYPLQPACTFLLHIPIILLFIKSTVCCIAHFILLPFGENPLVLSHHCRGLMYSSPKGIMLDAAAIRPNSLWNGLTVSDWPSLIHFTADRMDSIRAVTGAPTSTLSPIPRQGRWSSVVEKAHSFWHLAVTPTLSCGLAQHFDAVLPTDATELESTNCQCSS